MKKLVLTLLLATVAANAFGMEAAKIAKYQYRLEQAKGNTEMAKSAFVLFGVLGATALAVPYICQMWDRYLTYLERKPQNAQTKNASQTFNWAPYAKIATGLGLSALALKLAVQETPTSISIKNDWTVTNTPPASVTSHNGSNNTETGAISNSFYTFAFSFKPLIPMIPAYFFLKSGFDDLKAARDEESFKMYVKEHPEITKHNPVITSQSPSYV